MSHAQNDPFLTNAVPPHPEAQPVPPSTAQTSGYGSQPVRMAAASPVDGPAYAPPPAQQAYSPPPTAGRPASYPPPGYPYPPPDPFAGHPPPGAPYGSAPNVDDPFLTHAGAARRDLPPPPPQRGFFGWDYRDIQMPRLRQEGGHRDTMFPEGCFGEFLGDGDEKAQKWIGYLYVFVPYAIFLITLFLCLVVRHKYPTTALLICALMGIFGVYLMLFEQSKTKHGDISLTVLGGLTAIAVILGLIAGSIGWVHYVRQAWWLQTGTLGKDVFASDPALSYNDAAWLQFSSANNGTVVDTSNSAGYKEVDIFCAAPIMEGPLVVNTATTTTTVATTALTTTAAVAAVQDASGTTIAAASTVAASVSSTIAAASTTQAAQLMQKRSATWKRRLADAVQSTTALSRIEFWAVGINCCDELGGFRCTGEDDFNSGSGLVLLDGGYPCPGCNAEQFDKAISKAEASYGFVSAPGALKVQWIISTSAYETWVGWRVAIYVIAISMVAFMIIAPLGWAANYYGLWTSKRLDEAVQHMIDMSRTPKRRKRPVATM